MKRPRGYETLEYFLGLDWKRDGANCSAQVSHEGRDGQYLFYLDGYTWGFYYNHWGENGEENIDEEMDYEIDLPCGELKQLQDFLWNLDNVVVMREWVWNNSIIHPLDVEMIMDDFLINKSY